MKTKIISFIKKLKTLFTERKSAMGKMRFHAPYVEKITEDESQLDKACQIIDKLDDSKHPQFEASLLHYVMDKVIPVFRNWRDRMNVIAQNPNVSGHIKAKSEYQTFRDEIYQLVTDLNRHENTTFIAFDLNADCHGQAIIKAYEKQRYLLEYPIQVVEEEMPLASNTIATLSGNSVIKKY